MPEILSLLARAFIQLCPARRSRCHINMNITKKKKKQKKLLLMPVTDRLITVQGSHMHKSD